MGALARYGWQPRSAQSPYQTLAESEASGLGSGQWKGLVLIALELGELSRAQGSASSSGNGQNVPEQQTGLLQRQA